MQQRQAKVMSCGISGERNDPSSQSLSRCFSQWSFLADEELFEAIAQWSFLESKQQPVEEDLSSEVRTAVVMGPTTSGKTQILKTMHQLFNNDIVPDSLLVGRGSLSSTAEVNKYPLKASTIYCKTLRRRDLLGLSLGGRVSREQLIDILAGNVKKSRDYYLDEYFAKPKYGQRKYDLDLIDSPGSQDSYGRDEQHMMKLARALAAQGNVSAFIFVIGHGMPYDIGFQTSFNYFWNWLTDHRGNFIVVHTKWDMFQRNFECSAEARIADFKDMFRGTDGVKHIFIDSKWEEEQPEARRQSDRNQQKKALATEAIGELVNAILMMPTIPCSTLEFQKTAGLLEIDKQLRAMAEQAMIGTERAIDTTKSDIYSLNQQRMAKFTKVEDLEREVTPLRTRLAAINTEAPTVLDKREVYIWHLWGWKTVSLETTIPIRDVRTVMGTYTVTSEVWSVSDFQRKIKIHSGSIPTVYVGTVEACGYSKDVFAGEIREIQERLNPLETRMQEQKDDHSYFQRRLDAKQQSLNCLDATVKENSLVLRYASMLSVKLTIGPKFFGWYQTLIINGGQVSDSDFSSYKLIIAELDVM